LRLMPLKAVAWLEMTDRVRQGEFGKPALSSVFGDLVARGLKPFFYGVARQSRALCDLAVGELLAHLHAPAAQARVIGRWMMRHWPSCSLKYWAPG
jgi:hypothetical protein